jgi:hypothetical protein
MLPDPSMELLLVIVLCANLPASELEAFVEAIDSLVYLLVRRTAFGV